MTYLQVPKENITSSRDDAYNTTESLTGNFKLYVLLCYENVECRRFFVDFPPEIYWCRLWCKSVL